MSGLAPGTLLKAAARKSLPESVFRKLRTIGSSVLPWTRISTRDVPPTSNPLIVYLARQHEGAAVFRRFIASYREFSDATPHDLLIIFKGFRTESYAEEYRRILGGTSFIEMKKRDAGFDIGSFRKAAEHFHYSHYLFLNSFCRIRCEDYLTKLLNCLSAAPRAGVAGPSGSWEQGMAQVFPNYHVRTSAFLVSRSVLASVYWPAILSKYDTYAFEHGSKSITRQIMAMGLEPYVVDADGRWFAKEQWPRSLTYRAGRQEALMISDKQTEIFASSDRPDRQRLARLAWGATADNHLGIVGGWSGDASELNA